MAEEISLEILIEADKADLTLGQLREGFKSLEEELENTKRGTKRFDELSTAMAQTNREIKNMELGFEALDNEQVASEIGSVAGAIGDVTAAFILMGGESETMQQIGANIEKAMAVSMGLKGAIEGISSAQKLWTNLLKTHTVVQKALTVATKLFKFALAATGIGLIVVAVAALVGKLDTLKGVFISIGETIYSWFKPMIDLVIDGLQMLGIMESDAEKATREATESMIEQSKNLQAQKEKEIETHKRITDEIVQGLDFEIARRKAAGKDTAKLEKEKIEVLKEAALVELQLQMQKTTALKEEMKARIRLGDVTQEQIDKFKEDAKQQVATLRSGIQTIKKLSNDLEVHEITQEKKAQELWEKRKGRLTEGQTLEQITHDVRMANAQEEIDMTIKMVATQGSLLAQLEAIKQEQEDKEKARFEEEEERRQKRFELATESINALSAGADAFIKDEIKREKIKKKLALAQIAIDTARSISSVVTAATSTSITPIDLAIKLASGLAMVFSNISQAKALLGSSETTSAAGLSSAAASSGGASGGVPINPVSNTSTILGDQQVYVTETDITATQNKVGVIEASATF